MKSEEEEEEEETVFDRTRGEKSELRLISEFQSRYARKRKRALAISNEPRFASERLTTESRGMTEKVTKTSRTKERNNAKKLPFYGEMQCSQRRKNFRRIREPHRPKGVS